MSRPVASLATIKPGFWVVVYGPGIDPRLCEVEANFPDRVLRALDHEYGKVFTADSDTGCVLGHNGMLRMRVALSDDGRAARLTYLVRHVRMLTKAGFDVDELSSRLQSAATMATTLRLRDLLLAMPPKEAGQ